MLLIEAKPGGPMDRFGSISDGASALAMAKELMGEFRGMGGAGAA